MAEGWLPAGAGAALDAVFATWKWLKLHTGAPGAAGTSNAATETTRKSVTFATTGSDGITENTGAVSYTAIAGSQDATHATFWDASTAGTVGTSGTITANPYTAGDTLSFAVGAIVASVPLAS